MSQTKQQPGGRSRPQGCSTSVIVFASLAILFIGVALAILVAFGAGAIFSKPDESIMDEASTKIAEWIGGDSSSASEAESVIDDAEAEAESAVNDAEAEEASGLVAPDESSEEGEEPAVTVSGPDTLESETDPVVVPGQEGGQPEQPAAAADPEPESTSTVPETIVFEAPALGLAMNIFDNYSYGSMVDKPHPYSFVKPDACAMRVDVFTMPTAELPGETPLDAVEGATRRRLHPAPVVSPGIPWVRLMNWK